MIRPFHVFVLHTNRVQHSSVNWWILSHYRSTARRSGRWLTTALLEQGITVVERTSSLLSNYWRSSSKAFRSLIEQVHSWVWSLAFLEQGIPVVEVTSSLLVWHWALRARYPVVAVTAILPSNHYPNGNYLCYTRVLARASWSLRIRSCQYSHLLYIIGRLWVLVYR